MTPEQVEAGKKFLDQWCWESQYPPAHLPGLRAAHEALGKVEELERFSPAVDDGRQLFLHGCGMSVTSDPAQTRCRWCADKSGDAWLPLYVQAPVELGGTEAGRG